MKIDSIIPIPTPTPGGEGITSLPVANTLFVSGSGNNSTALPNRFDKPYLTINAALEDATANDCIVVYSGNYTVNSLTFPTTTRIFTHTGAQITFDNLISNSQCELLEVAGFGDVIFEDLSEAQFGASTFTLKVSCTDFSFVNCNFDFIDVNVSIKCLGSFFSAAQMQFFNCSVYNRFTVDAEYIELADGMLHMESNLSVSLTSRSGRIKGYLQGMNTSGKLFDIKINGDLYHSVVTNVPAIHLEGDFDMYGESTFSGLTVNGKVVAKCNNYAVLLEENTSVRFSNDVYLQIANEVSDDTWPTIHLNSGTASRLVISNGAKITNQNSTGVNGILHIDNADDDHSVTIDCKFIQGNLSGNAIESTNAGQSIFGGTVISNVEIDTPNISEKLAAYYIDINIT